MSIPRFNNLRAGLKGSALFSLVLITSLCFAQTNKDPNVIETYAGRSFTITLDANPSTGYGWEFTKPLDKNLLELVSVSHSINNPNLVGSPGKAIWVINALKPGETEIFFKYVRPWEKNVKPAKLAYFKIIIKELFKRQ